MVSSNRILWLFLYLNLFSALWNFCIYMMGNGWWSWAGLIVGIGNTFVATKIWVRIPRIPKELREAFYKDVTLEGLVQEGTITVTRKEVK